jgi:hypothetical protein
VVDVYRDGDAYRLVLAKSWIMYYAGVPFEAWADNYVAAGTARDSSQMSIRPVTSSRFAHDGLSEYSRIQPIAGTGTWLQVSKEIGPGSNARFRVIDPTKHRDKFVTSFLDHNGDPETSAYAVCESGQFALVVTRDHALVWDLVQLKTTEPPDLSSLRELRNVLGRARGSAGTWWMSNDLRYVVVAAPLEQYENGSVGGLVDPVQVTIAGTTLTLGTEQELIYDRQLHRVSTIPLILGDRQMRLRDALSTDGQILLLYGAIDGFLPTRKFAITSVDGRAIANCTIDVPGQNLRVSSWDASTGTVLLLASRSGGLPGGPEFTRAYEDCSLWEWAVGPGTLRQIVIPTESIRQAIRKP